MHKSSGLAINGAFLHRDAYPEGRVASEYLRAFQSLKKQQRYYEILADLEVLLTEDSYTDVPGLTARYEQKGKLPRPVWQQTQLPMMAKNRLLLNFCNIGPIFRSHAVGFIHDVNVYESPQSYSKPYVLYTKFLNAMMGKHYKRIYTVSQYSADALVEKGVVKRENIRVIHNGVDHADRTPTDERILSEHGLKKNGYVLGLSNSYKHKNMGVVMDCFNEMARPQDHISMPLVLFGPDMKETFQDEGIEPSNQVVFTGRVSEGERRALYENALCFVFPSKHEGFGLPPVEAMRLGCPVIASRCASIPEVCGEAAMYADADDVSSWSAAIAEHAENSVLRSKNSALGIAQAAQYTWETAARHLLEDLLEIR